MTKLVETDSPLRYLYIDLFCGAGGVTTGVEAARVNGKKVAKVIACVNHDPEAIQSHAMNHRKVLHFTEDIRTLNLAPLVRLVAYYRAKYPRAILVLWASAECIHHSKAKGGGSRDPDSRTLPEHLYRYVAALRPDLIQIENVVEFRGWGPLVPKVERKREGGVMACSCPLAWDERKSRLGPVWVPESKTKGRYFLAWQNAIRDMGYAYSDRDLNAADFGAYTSRVRYFGQFHRPNLPIAWPEATHSKKPAPGMFGGLKKWMPVREVLDFSDEGKSIFNRKKPLVENTLARIYNGLKKHVTPESGAFITKYLSNNSKTGTNAGASVHAPAPTVTTQNRLYLTQAAFLTKYHGTGASVSVDGPASTLTTKDRLNLIKAVWLDKSFSSGPHNHQSVNAPAGALTTVNKFSVVHACWLDKQYSGEANHQSVNVPAGAVLPNDKHCLIRAKSWIMPTSYTNVGRPISEPCPTVLASRKHHYIVNPQFFNKGNSVDSPAPTLIASMGKRPLSLVTATVAGHGVAELSHISITPQGGFAIVIRDTDSRYTKLIKELMAELGIVDITMRMLQIPELKLIQGFRTSYLLAGNQSSQKKFIGNAVHPILPQKMTEANYRALKDYVTLPLLAAA